MLAQSRVLVRAHSGANFREVVRNCLAKFGLEESDILTSVTDNCTKEATAAGLINSAEDSSTCKNHTLALSVQ